MSTAVTSSREQPVVGAGELTPAGALAELVGALELAEGTRLARVGHYGEADAALSVARTTPSGLDLRARMAAQQGRYDEAADLWRQAAERLDEPSAFAAELAAVSRLQARRSGRPPRAVGAVLAVGAAIGVVAGSVGWVVSSRSSTDDAVRELREDTLDAIDQRAEEDRAADEALAERLDGLDDAASGSSASAGSPGSSGSSGSPGSRDSSGSPGSPGSRDSSGSSGSGSTGSSPGSSGSPGDRRPAAALDALAERLAPVAGVVTTRDGDALQLRFAEPVFAEGLAPTSAGLLALADVAEALRPDVDRLLVVVTGHTDSLPLGPGSGFDDNGELALARAQAAVDGLVGTGLPADALTVRVTATPAPYPEMGGPGGPATETRNRTITLTVYERAPVSAPGAAPAAG